LSQDEQVQPGQVRGLDALELRVMLDAVSAERRIRWDRGLSPDQRAELDRLRKDGVTVTETSRSFDLTLDPEVARKVLLYRTVLHEIGHWVDQLEKVELPSERPDGDWLELWDRYWQTSTNARPSVSDPATLHSPNRCRRCLLSPGGGVGGVGRMDAQICSAA